MSALEIPPPGHAAARLQGCICPRHDNNHGAGVGMHDDAGRPIFAMVPGCPLHWPDESGDSVEEFRARLL